MPARAPKDGYNAALERLKKVLTGTGLRGKKAEDLFEAVASDEEPVQQWAKVLLELEAVILCLDREGGLGDAPDTPVLSRYYSSTDLERIAGKLSEEEWMDLSVTELRDIPCFEYRQGEMEYIQFSDASAGQQATALLRVLLNEEGPPLIIDQPEEDLDNQVMLEIVQDIWRAKRKRQIIVASHNANIVVNGDADLVAVCDYRNTGDQSGGWIKCQGAIDIADIKKEITTVMEGGKEAFRLRKEKYGF